jgi:hypothetical protein
MKTYLIIVAGVGAQHRPQMRWAIDQHPLRIEPARFGSAGPGCGPRWRWERMIAWR